MGLVQKQIQIKSNHHKIQRNQKKKMMNLILKILIVQTRSHQKKNKKIKKTPKLKKIKSEKDLKKKLAQKDLTQNYQAIKK